MKLLFVRGDDYSALNFEEYCDPDKVFKQMTADGETKTIINNDNVYAEVELLEFGNVDPKFITFVCTRIQDYDDSKHENFYVVEEDY